MDKVQTLQDLIHQSGSLQEDMARAYVRQIEAELTDMHQQRHICHLDVRPAMIIINASGKAHLASSSLCQAYSEEGASIDRRDLQAVCQYLLTGKKDVERDAVCEEPEPIPTESLRYSEQTGKRSNASVYLLSVIGLVMAGSLFCYFFFPSEKQPSKVAKQQYADYDYQGEILDGKPHGAGTARYHDGRYYQGAFSQGKRQDRHARFVYADGNVFEGVFAADTIQQGRVDLASKEFYFTGSFSQGKPYTGFWYRTSDNKKVEQVINLNSAAL